MGDPTLGESVTRPPILVLKGGTSGEREISLVSAQHFEEALSELGYPWRGFDTREGTAALLKVIERYQPELALNALHGRHGEDGEVQAILDSVGLAYSHSGVLASALAMDKHRTKRLLAAFDFPLAKDKPLKRHDVVQLAKEGKDPLPRPFVLKPSNEGSTLAVAIFCEGDNRKLDSLLSQSNAELWLAETFIPGKELTVVVMGDRPLCVTEIISKRGFYDYEAKYAEGGSWHRLPAPISPKSEARAMELALQAHQALGCEGVTRSDFRLNDEEQLYFLEINTQPGVTPTSLVPEQALYCGISFVELVEWIVSEALERSKRKGTRK